MPTQLANVMNQLDSLISDEDVMECADGLEPNSSEAILVFEHTWAKPLRDAIVNSGGVLANEHPRSRASSSKNCSPNSPNSATTDHANTPNLNPSTHTTQGDMNMP